MKESKQQSQQQNLDQDLHSKWLGSLTPQQVDALAMSLSKLALSVAKDEQGSSTPLQSRSSKRGTNLPQTQTSVDSQPSLPTTSKQSDLQDNKEAPRIPDISKMDATSLEMARSLGFLS